MTKNLQRIVTVIMILIGFYFLYEYILQIQAQINSSAQTPALISGIMVSTIREMMLLGSLTFITSLFYDAPKISKIILIVTISLYIIVQMVLLYTQTVSFNYQLTMVNQLEQFLSGNKGTADATQIMETLGITGSQEAKNLVISGYIFQVLTALLWIFASVVVIIKSAINKQQKNQKKLTIFLLGTLVAIELIKVVFMVFVMENYELLLNPQDLLTYGLIFGSTLIVQDKLYATYALFISGIVLVAGTLYGIVNSVFNTSIMIEPKTYALIVVGLIIIGVSIIRFYQLKKELQKSKRNV